MSTTPTTEPVVEHIEKSELYGLLAEFEHAEDLLEATRKTRAAGYRRIDAYTPIPIHGLTEAMGSVPTRLPWLTLLGGLLGAATGYGMQYYATVLHYPLNIGGRPYHSWPAYVPIIFELTVLGAALFSVFGMLALNGLPMPYHPVFNVPQFRLASRDRFFLCIEARDAAFDEEKTAQFLQSLNPHGVWEVPR
jgi:hypothetical protein